jgi:3-methyladenine DNA glycosylase/8-oxoguanine DNA glycosylase
MRVVALTRPLDLAATLGPLRRTARDPCARIGPTEAWRATRTPEGPASQRIRVRGREAAVEAWGPGADWLLARAPALLGEEDDPSGFRPQHRLVAELARRLPGLRLTRSWSVMEALTASIIEQKVPGAEARSSYARLMRTFGEPAPGPAVGLRVPPAPERLARTPYEVFHRFGLERRRTEVLRRAASYARRVEECASMPSADAMARLTALPGIGPWTAAEVVGVSHGDPDAVPVGDYHHPHMVAFALAGEERATDERMLELLEPYRGHRNRVLRLLLLSGIGPPRRGPRMALNAGLGF